MSQYHAGDADDETHTRDHGEAANRRLALTTATKSRAPAGFTVMDQRRHVAPARQSVWIATAVSRAVSKIKHLQVCRIFADQTKAGVNQRFQGCDWCDQYPAACPPQLKR
jgi:hypothetical protein